MRMLGLLETEPFVTTDGSMPHFGTGKHTSAGVTLPKCCDARKDACPYALYLSINTMEIELNETFCTAHFKKSEEAEQND